MGTLPTTRRARSTSNPTTLRVSRLNSTPTRWIGSQVNVASRASSSQMVSPSPGPAPGLQQTDLHELVQQRARSPASR